MTWHVILVDEAKDWKSALPDFPVATADSYLREERYRTTSTLRVVNLCRSYEYLSLGYYCSLLAEARGHRVLPSVRAIRDLSQPGVGPPFLQRLGKRLQRSLDELAEGADRHVLFVAFGQCGVPGLRKLGRQLFEVLRVPLLRVELRKNAEWRVVRVRAASLRRLRGAELELLGDALSAHAKRPWRKPKARRHASYDLAILHDPNEAFPPSNPRALQKFAQTGESLGIATEFVRARDFARLGEFDALLIRETTAIPHHTYRFAKRAEDEGLAVIDDPDSILHCTNKVYLAELLAAKGVATPRTVLFRTGELGRVADELGFPLVVKVPDGSFSRGVHKVDDFLELEELSARLLAGSEILLAQEYLYTPFDWRIGVLAGEPLYACRYEMSRGHWQIVDHRRQSGQKQKARCGGHQTLPLDAVPRSVLDTALRAAAQIGDGLYGVDLKAAGDRIVVIEVNDNPNLDAGVEDQVLGDALYLRILRELKQRVDVLRGEAP